MKGLSRHIIFSALFLGFLINDVHSQKHKRQIDSLLILINKAEDDSNKVNLYRELGRYYGIFTSKENNINNLKALNLALKIGFISGANKQYVLLITNFFHRGDYDLAMAYQLDYEKFLIENKLNDDLLASYNMYANLLVSKKGTQKHTNIIIWLNNFICQKTTKKNML